MPAVYLGGAGVVSRAGRGLTALQTALRAPAPRPETFHIAETRPPLALAYLPAKTGGDRLFERVDAAVADALAGTAPGQRADMPVFLASSAIDLIDQEPDYAAAVARGESPVAFMNPQPGYLAARIARRFGVNGGEFTINTACSSGANALRAAAAKIRRGDCDRALVIGVESLSRVTVAGFQSLLLLSKTRNRPFDVRRDGIVFGEAVAALVLQATDPPGALAGVRLLGGATGCDTASPTQTSSDATAEVITRALACTATTDLVAVKAHGTGTPANDAAEAHGLRAAGVPAELPMTSLKPTLGHTLGACGVLETIAAATCWRQGFLPATGGFEQPDPCLDRVPVTRATPLPPGRMLLNYFGFGGNSCVLVLEYAP